MNEKILNSGFWESSVRSKTPLGSPSDTPSGNNFKKFFALDTKAYHEGAIPAKYKELMGLTASMVLRCNDCIFYHLDQSIKLGAKKGELYEAMNIALIACHFIAILWLVEGSRVVPIKKCYRYRNRDVSREGSIVIPHLRYAFSVLDELMKEKDETNLT